MYTKSMLESMKKVEETRDARVNEKLPLLSLEEKTSILRGFHPDYIESTIRKLKVGASTGERVVNEFADLLEAYSIVESRDIDLKNIDYDTDVLIIGAGGAGVSAALTAHEMGAKVVLATKLRVGDANTMMAQGGIQAADKPNDSPAIHYLDVIGGGDFHNIPELVRALVNDAPLAIQWLEDLGVMFDKKPDGEMATMHGGGTSRKRMHSARDYTGGEIMKTIRDELRSKKDITVLEYTAALELLTDSGVCTGAVLFNLETKEYRVARAKTVIVATGGCGRLHIQGFPCTNHYGATGDGVVLAYRAGAKLAFMDTIQYHPTGAAFPEQIVGQLITEKTRSVGAQMVNREGNRFIYELETRDVEAAAIIRECRDRKLGVETPSGMQGIWLDSPLIEIIHGKGAVKRLLPAMFRQYERFGIDMSKDPILVYPTQHYQNGGVLISDNTATNVKGLYVAGEATGGIHGRNRLMGNSLLDVIVFGRRAGAAAANAAKKTQNGKITLAHMNAYHKALEAAKIPRERKSPMILPDYRTDETKKKYMNSLVTF